MFNLMGCNTYGQGEDKERIMRKKTVKSPAELKHYEKFVPSPLGKVRIRKSDGTIVELELNREDRRKMRHK